MKPGIIKLVIYLFLFFRTYELHAYEVKTPFTVEDAFRREMLYDTQVRKSPTEARPFLFSNDNKKVFIIKGRGIPELKTYHFDLLMFSTSDLTKFVRNASASAPTPKVIVSVQYDQGAGDFPVSESGGIKNLQLTNNNESILFLSPDDRGVYQIYLSNLYGLPPRQITYSDSHVIQFLYLPKTNNILYTVGVYNKTNHCAETRYSLEALSILEMTCLSDGQSIMDHRFKNNPPIWLEKNIYAMSLSGDVEPRLVAANLRFNTSFTNEQLSPNEKFMVLAVESIDPLLEPEDKSFLLTSNNSDNNLFGTRDVASPRVIIRYGILNIAEGGFSFIPEPRIDRGYSKNVRWSGNDKVIISSGEVNSKLDAKNNIKRGFEIKIGEKEFDIKEIYIRNISSASIEQYSVLYYCPINTTGVSEKKAERSACYAENRNINIVLSKEERYNTLPVLFIIDAKSGRKKRLYQLNEFYNQKTLGEVRDISWRDEKGGEWRGGLVLPPGYKHGEKYPLVIQLDGYSPDFFLMDGSPQLTAPFAAQALANKNIIVLQIAKNYKMLKSWGEPAQAEYGRGVKAAIQYLIKNGIIDQTKIGIIGYSATGRLAFDLTVFPDFVPRAVKISDSSSPSPLGYVSLYRLLNDGLSNHENMYCGSWPWGEQRGEWIRRNPFYHLNNVQSAISIEKFDSYITDWWDIFVGLRRLRKPVEHYLYKGGGHPPLRPDIVLASQQHTVEWFDFWLNGHVSSDSRKARQYEEWRRMEKLLPVRPARISSSESFSQMDCSK